MEGAASSPQQVVIYPKLLEDQREAKRFLSRLGLPERVTEHRPVQRPCYGEELQRFRSSISEQTPAHKRARVLDKIFGAMVISELVGAVYSSGRAVSNEGKIGVFGRYYVPEGDERLCKSDVVSRVHAIFMGGFLIHAGGAAGTFLYRHGQQNRLLGAETGGVDSEDVRNIVQACVIDTRQGLDIVFDLDPVRFSLGNREGWQGTSYIRAVGRLIDLASEKALQYIRDQFTILGGDRGDLYPQDVAGGTEARAHFERMRCMTLTGFGLTPEHQGVSVVPLPAPGVVGAPSPFCLPAAANIAEAPAAANIAEAPAAHAMQEYQFPTEAVQTRHRPRTLSPVDEAPSFPVGSGRDAAGRTILQRRRNRSPGRDQGAERRRAPSSRASLDTEILQALQADSPPCDAVAARGPMLSALQVENPPSMVAAGPAVREWQARRAQGFSPTFEGPLDDRRGPRRRATPAPSDLGQALHPATDDGERAPPTPALRAILALGMGGCSPPRAAQTRLGAPPPDVEERAALGTPEALGQASPVAQHVSPRDLGAEAAAREEVAAAADRAEVTEAAVFSAMQEMHFPTQDSQLLGTEGTSDSSPNKHVQG